MSELGKKVPEDSDWYFGGNVVSRITFKLESLASWHLYKIKILGMTITKNFCDKSNDYYLFH